MANPEHNLVENWLNATHDGIKKEEQEITKATEEVNLENRELKVSSQHKDEALQSEATARIKAEEDNAKLVEALQRAGIDPNSVLSGVNVASVTNLEAKR